ncbi:MAG: hypothetical protein C4523_02850 [Myxococcales bacterium]|nr:MAG: hypothetical protein C4523_02850 [Myxococcales bacterium]
MAPDRADVDARKIAFAQGVMAEAQAIEIIERLAEDDIPVIPWKGVLFRRTLYDDPAERPLTDLDLVAPAADFERAADVLERIGYVSERTARARFGFAAVFERGFIREGFLPVELHRALATGHGATELTRRIFDEGRPAAGIFPQPNVHAPTPEQTLVGLALHFREHGLQMLPYQFDDVRRLLIRLRPDLGHTARLAGEVGALLPLALLLEAAGETEASRRLVLAAPLRWRRATILALTRLGDGGFEPILPGSGTRNGDRLWRLLLHLALARDSFMESARSQAMHGAFLARELAIGRRKKGR